MLLELRIRNLAVLEDLNVPLAPGLNVITGETGAGKSIIVDALVLLMGGRASADVVRPGADRMWVEGVLDVGAHLHVLARLREMGFEAEDGQIDLKREVSHTGRSRAWINGSPTTATLVRGVTAGLLDVHGQHEHQRLLTTSFQQEVLDAFAGATGLAGDVRSEWARVSGLERELEELQERTRDLQRRGDFLRFELAELDGAGLEDPDEIEVLAREWSRLRHVEELAGSTRALYDTLYGADESLSDALSRVLARLKKSAALDPTLSPEAEGLETSYHEIVDLASRLGELRRLGGPGSGPP